MLDKAQTDENFVNFWDTELRLNEPTLRKQLDLIVNAVDNFLHGLEKGDADVVDGIMARGRVVVIINDGWRCIQGDGVTFCRIC